MSGPRDLVVELCRELYQLGWASGTGGGISVRDGDRIYVAPSAVHKERLAPADVFVVDRDGQVLEAPTGLRISQCTPLFLAAYRQRDAGAVLHSHSLHALLATVTSGEVFRTSHLEMQKGIEGVGYHDTLEVPIVENTAYEADLAGSLSAAIGAWPRTQAVLVRRHGVYVWGRDWRHAKTQAECYHYLFEAAVRMRALGLDPAVSSPRVIKWPHRHPPTAAAVRAELERLDYVVYDLQTVPAWFDRARHAHDEPEIRGAVSGVITFHFDTGPITLEPGDILTIPGGTPHGVRGHNDQPFTAWKGSVSGVRRVTELGMAAPSSYRRS